MYHNFVVIISSFAFLFVLPSELFSTLRNQEILNNVNFQTIQGTNPEEICDFIRNFPFQNYEAITVGSFSGHDSFYVDPIPDYIKNDIRSGRFWEPHVSGYVLKYSRPGSIAVDIGAHIGSHTLTMSRGVGPYGKVIAFEPQPKTFRELVLNMSLNNCSNIVYFWGAAGNEPKIVELDPLNSANEGTAGIGHGGTGKFVKQITLDSLELYNVSLIKIDVEGMEDQVLEGATQTILRNKPVILIEIAGGQLPESAPPHIRDEIYRRVKMVEDFGYEVERIMNHWDYLAIPKD